MIKADVATLGIDINRIIEKTKGNASQIARKVGFELQSRVINKSPVDTGRLRGNWNVSMNSIDVTEYAPDKVGGAVMARANSELSTYKIGDMIYITNSLPYVSTLEFGLYGTGKGATVKTTRDGYSVQAPYGFVRITYQEVSSGLEDMARKVVK